MHLRGGRMMSKILVFVQFARNKMSLGLFGFSLLISSQASYALTLEEQVEIELQNPTPVFSGPLEQTLKGRHVVLVDGIMNELAKLSHTYYTDYIRVLKKNGISYSHLAYPSRVSIPNNARALAQDLLAISERVHKPIILIGHSMGGAESVYAVLDQPSLLLNGVVEKVVSFEGAIGGSDLADHLKERGLGKFLKKHLSEGLDSIRSSVAKRNFHDVRAKYELSVWNQFGAQGDQVVEQVFQDHSNRVFYVQSEQPPGKRLSWGLRAIFPVLTLKSLGAPSDGLLKLEDQILSGFGRSLGIFTADHIELVVSGLVAHSSSVYRKAFFRALLTSLYSGDGAESKATQTN